MCNQLHIDGLGGLCVAALGGGGEGKPALMARMGHDSADTAMVYQHANSKADRAIADAVDKAVREAQDESDDDPDDGAAGFPARTT